MDYQLDLHGQMLMEQYRERLADYRRLAQVAEEALRRALKEQHVSVIALEHRIKAEASLAGKLELKGAKYRTLDDVTDILGMRVITFYSDDVDKVAAIAGEIFQVDWSNSVDKRKLHRLDSFGYNSLHYICRLKDPPPAPPRGRDCRAGSLPSGRFGGGLPFEIQMRTALQHVWSTLDHDVVYKGGGVNIPNEYRRQFNRLAGMLELIDEEFSRLRNVLTDYRRQMLALEASGQLDKVDLNSDTFRRYLEAQPFARLNQRIAAINQAELYPAPLMPFLPVLQKLGFETLGDVNRLIDEHSDDAYRLAVSQLGTTDLDILSENIGLQNLCFVYVLKRGGGPAELCQIYDLVNGQAATDEEGGSGSGNMALAKALFEQARTLSFTTT